jgi:hypothetical protein
MPRRIYYRRQADLCLQLALLQNSPRTTVLLVALAKELRAKADIGDSGPIDRWIPERPRTASYLTPPDQPPRRRGPENPQA